MGNGDGSESYVSNVFRPRSCFVARNFGSIKFCQWLPNELAEGARFSWLRLGLGIQYHTLKRQPCRDFGRYARTRKVPCLPHNCFLQSPRNEFDPVVDWLCTSLMLRCINMGQNRPQCKSLYDLGSVGNSATLQEIHQEQIRGDIRSFPP